MKSRSLGPGKTMRIRSVGSDVMSMIQATAFITTRVSVQSSSCNPAEQISHRLKNPVAHPNPATLFVREYRIP